MSSSSVLFDAPGPRSKRLYAAVGVASVILLLLALWFVYSKLDEKGQLTAAKWKPFLTGVVWTEYIIPGLIGTLTAAAISVVFALTLGTLLGVGRLSATAWIRIPCGVVVEFFRAVPVLMMMLFSYALYGYYEWFPSDRLALAAVVTGLTLYNGSPNWSARVCTRCRRARTRPRSRSDSPPARPCAWCCCRKQSLRCCRPSSASWW